MTYCAIYIRKSREDAKKAGHRLSAQREQLPKHALAQGWQVEIYDDGHASAARGKTEALTERTRLEQDIKQGKVGVILCIELSRLSRDDSLQDYVAWLHLCAEHNVRLATPSRVLDPAQPSDWMLLLMEGGFSSVEMRVLKARMEEGSLQALRDGKWIHGRPPAPYVYDKALRKPIVDRQQLKTMQKLWAMAEDQSARYVARELGMTEISVRRAISDERLLTYQALRKDPETGDFIECDWQPVITAEQAERIRAGRRTRRQNVSRKDAAALLSNLRLLYCGYCGRTAKTWKNNRSSQYYGCNTKNSRLDCPESRLIKEEELNKRVLQNVFKTLRRTEALEEAWAAGQQNGQTAEQLAEIDRGIALQADKKKRLAAAIAEGILDFADAREKRQEIEETLAKLRDKRLAILPKLNPAPPPWEELSITPEEFEVLAFEEQRQILQTILDRVDIYYGHAIITYRFPRNTKGETTSRINFTPPQRTHHTRART